MLKSARTVFQLSALSCHCPMLAITSVTCQYSVLFSMPVIFPINDLKESSVFGTLLTSYCLGIWNQQYSILFLLPCVIFSNYDRKIQRIGKRAPDFSATHSILSETSDMIVKRALLQSLDFLAVQHTVRGIWFFSITAYTIQGIWFFSSKS